MDLYANTIELAEAESLVGFHRQGFYRQRQSTGDLYPALSETLGTHRIQLSQLLGPK